MQEQYRKAHEAIKNGAKAQMEVALHTVIIGLGVRKLAVSDGLADLTGNELLSSRGRALVNREQELHIAQKVLCELLVKECRGLGRQQQCMSATQAAPAPVTVPTMEQKIAGAHAADIKPSQAEAVYLAMLATTPAAVPAAVAVPAEVTALLEALESMVDVCEGHDFDGAPSDAHMEKARAAISAYLAMLAATPAAAAPAAMAVQLDANGIAPCPLCGSESKHVKADVGGHRILCWNDDCECSSGYFCSKEEAITSWNDRAVLAATPAADTQDQEAIAREQEACALACEALVANATDWDSSYWDQACNRCALEVRNRKAQQNPQTKEST